MENRGKIEMIKNKYPVGTRIKLNYMDDNYSVPRGTCGTVEYVDDEGQIGMKWDNGSSLSLIYGVDSFEIITNKELNHNSKKNKDEQFKNWIDVRCPRCRFGNGKCTDCGCR